MAIKKSVSLTRRPRRSGGLGHSNSESDTNSGIDQETPANRLVTRNDKTCTHPPAMNLCGKDALQLNLSAHLQCCFWCTFHKSNAARSRYHHPRLRRWRTGGKK